MRNIAGPPAIADDFFGRERDVRNLWRRLEHNSVLLIAPRRVGKTSLLRRLEDRAATSEYCAVYLSVADAGDELTFVEQLYGAVANQQGGLTLVKELLRGSLKPLVKEIRSIKAIGGVTVEFTEEAAKDWQPLASSLAACLAKSDKQWLLMIDELPLFVRALLLDDPSQRRVRLFMNWFRKLRGEINASTKVRWLLSGSIGLESLTSGHELGDTINDLYLVSLGAFSHEEADQFLQALGQGELVLSAEARNHIIRLISWPIPYYLQVIYAKLSDYCDEFDIESPTTDTVDVVFDQLLLPISSTYFNWWEQRLERDLELDESKGAFAALKAIADAEEGVTLETLDMAINRAVDGGHNFRPVQVRDLLEREGYIHRSQNLYYFRSNLLREYWLRRVLGR